MGLRTLLSLANVGGWGCRLSGGLADAENGGVADGAVASCRGATVLEYDFFSVLDFTGCAALETVSFHQISLQIFDVMRPKIRFHRCDLSLSFRARNPELGTGCGQRLRFLTVFGMTVFKAFRMTVLG